MAPPPTAEQLWRAVVNWEPNPLSGSPSASIDPICDLIASRRFGSIPLGKLHHRQGIYPCALVPMGNALNPGLEGYKPPGLRHHQYSHDLAISYADGFPWEDNPQTKIRLPQKGESELVFSARTDKVLRRFLTLGHIMIMVKNKWIKTGHVLVLDADHGRKCHPWIVLATEWSIEDEAAAVLGEETWITTSRTVGPNDTTQPGILPGDHNRTTIAKLKPFHTHIEQHGGKLVEKFGPDFDFIAGRTGQNTLGDHRKPWGLTRAEIMEWYWDPTSSREVCFSKNGMKWHIYDPNTGYYGGPLASGKTECG